ncbi:histidine kinase [Brevibacterium sp. 91QC2O2]|uniref:sensor histidine kinase n=1 Tax=Brevibacterium sp. 91QC2O2 TaxID=2968458 RepID=UPI00211C0FDA|nr:histidine kinase [Brevibacterium sp. 91QC2O2]
MTPESTTGVPPWLRQGGRIVLGILYFFLAIFLSVLGEANATGHTTFFWAPDAASEPIALEILLWLTSMILWGSVFLRFRVPWLTFAAGAVLALIGMDYLLMLIGTHQLVRRGTRRQAGMSAIAAAIVLVFTVIRDSLRDPLNTVVGALFVPMDSDPGITSADALVTRGTTASVLALLALACYGLSVGIGYLLRANRRAALERGRATDAREELAHRGERDRLARELHDSQAHRLSLMSMQASALERRAGDTATAQAAAALRGQANEALNDMRTLVGGLRSNPRAAGAPPTAAMNGIPDLVANVRKTGTPVDAMIMVDRAKPANAVFENSVYRIVQEALTNAAKHAPGTPISLSVTADPERGARIRVANPLAAVGAQVPGGGNGLTGIRERAQRLGGQVWIGPFQGEFIVDATLPWPGEG